METPAGLSSLLELQFLFKLVGPREGKLDIREFVRKLRIVYRKCYMLHTLPAPWASKGKRMRMPMSYEHRNREPRSIAGFPNATIHCEVDPELAESGLFALNVIVKKGDHLQGWIFVSPEVFNLPIFQRKEIFAKEFLELALGMARLEQRRRRRSVIFLRKYIDATLRSSLTEEALAESMDSGSDSEVELHSIWQDSADERLELVRGIRYLLLSTESIERYLETIGLSRDILLSKSALRSLWYPKLSEQLHRFYNVSPKLAMERLDEFLRET